MVYLSTFLVYFEGKCIGTNHVNKHCSYRIPIDPNFAGVSGCRLQGYELDKADAIYRRVLGECRRRGMPWDVTFAGRKGERMFLWFSPGK